MLWLIVLPNSDSLTTSQEPVDPFVIGQKYNPVSPRPAEPDRFVIGGEYVEPAGPNNCLGPLCGGAVIEDRDNQVMMMMMDTSNLPVIGIGRNRRNLKVRRRRKLNRNK